MSTPASKWLKRSGLIVVAVWLCAIAFLLGAGDRVLKDLTASQCETLSFGITEGAIALAAMLWISGSLLGRRKGDKGKEPPQ